MMPVLICFLQKILVPEGYRKMIDDKVWGDFFFFVWLVEVF